MKSGKPDTIAEIQGEYGAFSISELILQRVWASGDFQQSELITEEGRRLEIVDLGELNRLAGPDFLNVRLKVDGELLEGDAELHFYSTDWRAHGHQDNPAFDKVVLHILVFPPKSPLELDECHVKNTLVFLNLLPQGLENYAEDAAVGALTDKDEEILEFWTSRSMEERHALVAEHALRRWKEKVGYARKRMRALDWEATCHQTALEILGYRYNRSAMSMAGADYSLPALRSGQYSVEDLYAVGRGRWKLTGTRPANHPRTRLAQYLDWVRSKPHWPSQLQSMGRGIESRENGEISGTNRRKLKCAALKKRLSDQITVGTVGGTRFDTLVIDGFLPLLAARDIDGLFPLWFYWYPGDMPHSLKGFIRKCGLGGNREQPYSNGLFQGLLGWTLHWQGRTGKGVNHT